MKKLSVLIISTFFFVIFYLNANEKPTKYLPEEIVFYENESYSGTYNLKYDKDNRLIGLDINYNKPSQTDNSEKETGNDSIRFGYGKDGRLISMNIIADSDSGRSALMRINYISNDTIILYDADSSKTLLQLNQNNKLLYIKTHGYELACLYDGAERLKSINTYALRQDAYFIDTLSALKTNLEYDVNHNMKYKKIFSDLQFSQWMLLYCGLEFLVYTPDVVKVYDNASEVADITKKLQYIYNEEGYPISAKSGTEDYDTQLTIRYRKID